MKKLLLLLLAGAFMLSSCDKQDTDLTVTLKNSGKLKVKLAGDDGKGIADTKVQLYLYNPSGSGTSGSFDSKKTNSDGVVDFGQVIENVYYIVAKDVKINGVKYNVSKPIMVTSGFDDEIPVNPQEFTGKISLTISKYSNTGYYSKGANLNIALIERTEYSDTMTHDEKLAKAAFTGVTNSSGKVVFEKVPAYYDFYVYVYLDEEQNVTILNGTVFTYKDDEREFNFSVNESDLTNLKVNIDLTVYYYDNYNYNYKYLNDVNVIVVKSNDYYNYSLSYESLDVIRNYQVASGVTNIDGKVSISLRAYKEYRVLVFKNSSQKTWCSNTLYTGSTNSTFSAEVEESYLGFK